LLQFTSAKAKRPDFRPAASAKHLGHLANPEGDDISFETASQKKNYFFFLPFFFFFFIAMVVSFK